jgi:hypothetical protein
MLLQICKLKNNSDVKQLPTLWDIKAATGPYSEINTVHTMKTNFLIHFNIIVLHCQ